MVLADWVHLVLTAVAALGALTTIWLGFHWRRAKWTFESRFVQSGVQAEAWCENPRPPRLAVTRFELLYPPPGMAVMRVGGSGAVARTVAPDGLLSHVGGGEAGQFRLFLLQPDGSPYARVGVVKIRVTYTRAGTTKTKTLRTRTKF